MRGDTFQILLILSGVIVSALFGAFLYREIFPEYKLYQSDYLALEEFRSTYTHEPLPLFTTGIKQIVIEREDKGPAVVDRCISCHVALQVPYFSPKKIAHDESGNVEIDKEGHPVLIKNEEYIWSKLDKKIAELRDSAVLEQLKVEGQTGEIARRLDQAKQYEDLKRVKVGHQVYDVTKVLSMHPLMGNETYPFQFHPMEEYGCTSCHNGNGRSVVTDRAHGPVFDGTYEIEDTGPTLKFTDSDPENDPAFAKAFNHHPGSDLIFQTEPIFVGALIQAKCVQCHQVPTLKQIHHEKSEKDQGEGDQNLNSSAAEEIEGLTLDYQKGAELYISQACYACHRIAGFARGGVGPELTQSGETYPWYLKRKLVWPQGDLPTSTMPNMRFDHKELEDLMTFLLAQKGSTNAVAKTAYKAAIQEWEGGKKAPWEKPVPSAQMYDLRNSMMIFATEGCAACHRLQGFESNVGFKEEQGTHSFNELYEKQHWFRRLFPEVVHISEYDEELPGSNLVEAIEKHSREIDESIFLNANKNGILEEIESKYPGLVESFYSPFQYASRSKDHYYNNLIANESDPEKAGQLKIEHLKWKERVHRVLMMYIQIYGFGRLIGPHLNWSGIYRTDEWLMEHFRNPSSHVPRSIMPVFPFDDTKFYALTFMLDQLAIKNRNALRQIWNQRGFEPGEVYQMLCAQCHGIDRVGNGAIAEWIYPIPKNLLNAEFLRNLTKDKAIYSIAHGVKGTPMPPWGEHASHKPLSVQELSKTIPVMNESEIHYLVDWLFSALPGGEVIRKGSDVPKWKYSPEDVLKELEKEGGELQPKTSNKQMDKGKLMKRSNSSFFPMLVAADSQDENELMSVDDVFDIVKKATDTGDDSYYIKKQFYTQDNIEAGKEFFLINCAACHGNEADGSSIRAGVMQESKPRMLTNLDWIQSRDDLRLLRSIKYGVPGTAMTPWGDLTNSLQRLQLVIFIRSLSLQQERRERLMSTLYQIYENYQLLVENGRIKNSQEIGKLQSEERQNKQQIDEIEKNIGKDQKLFEKALEVYHSALEIQQKLKLLLKEDQKFQDLQAVIKDERTIYFNLGVNLISKDVDDSIFQNFIELILLNGNRYELKEGKPLIHFNRDIAEKIGAKRQKIVSGLYQVIADLEKESQAIKKNKQTPFWTNALRISQSEIEGLNKLRDKILIDTDEALHLAEKQVQIIQTLNNGKN